MSFSPHFVTQIWIEVPAKSHHIFRFVFFFFFIFSQELARYDFSYTKLFRSIFRLSRIVQMKNKKCFPVAHGLNGASAKLNFLRTSAKCLRWKKKNRDVHLLLNDLRKEENETVEVQTLKNCTAKCCSPLQFTQTTLTARDRGVQMGMDMGHVVALVHIFFHCNYASTGTKLKSERVTNSIKERITFIYHQLIASRMLV